MHIDDYMNFLPEQVLQPSAVGLGTAFLVQKVGGIFVKHSSLRLTDRWIEFGECNSKKKKRFARPESPIAIADIVSLRFVAPPESTERHKGFKQTNDPSVVLSLFCLSLRRQDVTAFCSKTNMSENCYAHL
ncbi:MAG: hypothetical protein EXX96DRAFT_535471 [Benjaminiella poitrasii]|nr:MAG: hypothetical protein EXX96DRAFT_535471 [Benjaminiella poitrasii]